jgi:uncharacterized protein YdeI (YjbR/CyaY-like superfamily)
MPEPLAFDGAAQWESWLEQHHADRSEAWLRIAKKGSGLPLITITEALDVALCFGWIDGQRRSYDESSYVQRYCPRRAASSWSQVNRAKAEALLAAGRMRPAGLAQIAAARADGRWDTAYEPQRTATAPPDLAAALAASDAARAAFERLTRTERYTLMLPLLKARTPQARAARLSTIISALHDGRA